LYYVLFSVMECYLVNLAFMLNKLFLKNGYIWQNGRVSLKVFVFLLYLSMREVYMQECLLMSTERGGN